MTAVGRVLLTLIGIILIFLVLIQRGRGQGLAGAFGGMGGSSLLGTKAGSFIGKLTAWLAAAFILLAIVLNIAFNSQSGGPGPAPPPPPDEPPASADP